MNSVLKLAVVYLCALRGQISDCDFHSAYYDNLQTIFKASRSKTKRCAVDRQGQDGYKGGWFTIGVGRRCRT